MEFKTISVIGLGYIGLPTATVFAMNGINVIGVDVNQRAVNLINQGKIHIVEPGLDEAVLEMVQHGLLKATTAAEPADAFLIAVPTPFKGNGHEPDLQYIEVASKSIAPVLKKGDLVILESTVPVGTTEKMAEWLADFRQDLTFPQSEGSDSDIRIAHCPERVLPGQVLQELVSNDRVIGGMTDKCSLMASKLYEIILTGQCIITNARTAELCKLTENSYRDVNIAFANELSIICDKLNIDVWELISLANRHPRVDILQPGPGVGGHCIAVDPWFIVDSAPKEARLIKTARAVNLDKTDWVVERVLGEVASYLKREKRVPKVACLGLAFKPNIDDCRESPALKVYRSLQEKGLDLMAVEPNLGYLNNIELSKLEEVEVEADIILLLVKHKEFIGQNFTGIIFDFCGAL